MATPNMRCPDCNSEMGIKHERYQYRESGLENVWLDNCPMFVCPNCKNKMALLPDPDEMAKIITRDLVREKGRLDGDSIVFLRKAMGLKTAALAEMLGVHRGTVSRWENDKQEIDAFLDFRLRFQAVDHVLPKHLRSEVRDTISRILQHTYIHGIPVGGSTIEVPAETDVLVPSGIALAPLS